MRREIFRVPLDEGIERVRTILTDDQSPDDALGSRIAAHRMLQACLDAPDLLLCDLSPFKTLRMYRDGSAWSIEVEAEVHKT